MKDGRKVKRKALWVHPWGYKESFLIATALLLVGFLIEYATGGGGIRTLAWPANFYLLLVFINLIVFTHLAYKKKRFVRWMSSVPAAVSAISVFTVLILMMGFTHQDDMSAGELVRRLGLSHVTRSWPYLLIQFYFLITLGFVIMKRIWPLSRKNLGFLLNHLGLWIMIMAASLGAGDLIKLNMQLVEGKTVMVARDYAGNSYEMPLAIKLDNFNIEEYNPKVGLVDNHTRNFVGDEKISVFQVDSAYSMEVLDYKIEVQKYLPYAAKQDSSYVIYNGAGAVHAALIKVSNTKTKEEKTGWIASKSMMFPQEYLAVSGKYTLVMLRPEPKEYSSEVVVFSESVGTDSVIIRVNEPYKIEGWKIYQTGFDEQMGRDSNISIVEVVRDPWLVFVYIGIFMVIAGAGYIFWEGRKVKKIKEE